MDRNVYLVAATLFTASHSNSATQIAEAADFEPWGEEGPVTPTNDVLARLEREVAIMDNRLKLVEAGVANFRDHQSFMKDFVTEYRVEGKNKTAMDKRRARIHFTLLGGLITLVVGCAIALFTWVLDGHHAVVSNDQHSQTTFDAHIPKVR